jgi:hypothetical protein
VNVEPQRQNEKNYTAQIKINYPTDILEFDSITYWKGWVPVVRPGYDEVDAVNGTVVKTAGYADGFAEPKVFGVAKFTVKKSGRGVVSFGDTSYVLDREHQNSLAGMRLPKEIAVAAYPAKGTPESFLASIFGLGAEGLLPLILLLVFLGLLIGLYFFVKRADDEEEVMRTGSQHFDVRDEIFSAGR